MELLIFALIIYVLTQHILLPYLKRKVNRTRVIILTIAFLLFCVIGMMTGSIIGMDLGGKYYGDFVFNGLRGYEAVGSIGFIIGGILGVVCGLVLVLLIAGLKENGKDK